MKENEVWKILIYAASVITAVATEDLTGSQKKQLVVDETMTLLSDYSIPLPAYLIRALVSQVIEFLYQMLSEKNIV